MEPATENGQLGSASKRLAERLLVSGENRLELFLLELEEERNRFLRALGLVLGVAIFGLLAGVSLTVVIVVFFWHVSPVVALVMLTTLYSAISFFLYRRFALLKRDWRMLPATLDQIRKDRQCLTTKHE
jgi:uncharacterized membrane protein YqjE